jgi:sigma-E factor negative regulatory protein RseB
VGVVAALLPQPGRAQANEAAGWLPIEEARAWLLRIHQAANQGNYSGVLVFSAGSVVSSSRVLHVRVGSQTYERLDALDGRQQTVLRHNDDVHTLWPNARMALIEKRDALATQETTPQAVDPRLLEQYNLRKEGPSRVAGRDAVVLVLEPRDSLRYAQRLWADAASGLMLRADVLAQPPVSVVLESSGFSTIDVGIKANPRVVLDALRAMDGYRVIRPQQQRTRLEDEGWVHARPVAGFALLACLKRPVPTMAEDASPAPARALQAVFSDGLARVSVFIEPFDAGRHKREGHAITGATLSLAVRRQDHWITAVGDVPAQTLKMLVDSIERRP